MSWRQLIPDKLSTWLNEEQKDDFSDLLPISPTTKNSEHDQFSIFRLYSLGIVSARDAYVFNEHRETLSSTMKASIAAYEKTLSAFQSFQPCKPVDQVIEVDDPKIKWSRQTKASLAKGEHTSFSESYIRNALYRAYCKTYHYFDDFWNEERYQLPKLFPTEKTELENRAICLAGPGYRSPWSVIATSLLPTYTVCSSTDAFQCFPYYTYDEDGTNRRENITDWALTQFRKHYADDTITKWDIFHATYAVLHHPEYRTRYAANLKRELPRIPFPPDFHAFAAAGKKLMALHIDYERQPEYPLEQIEDPKAEVSFRVEKMKLSKDKSELRYNGFLTLRGIPAAAFDYRLGNRSALEWVIDQYRVSTDPRSGIVNDPNREDDPKYILRLIGKVITVSLETQQIIKDFPSLGLPG